jgi:hypothetical protein
MTELPPQTAGAVAVYCDARRRYEQSWCGAYQMDTRIAAALREQNEAGVVVLDMLFAHAGERA